MQRARLAVPLFFDCTGVCKSEGKPAFLTPAIEVNPTLIPKAIQF